MKTRPAAARIRRQRAAPEFVISARAVLPAGLSPCEIGISDGRIVAVGKRLRSTAPRLSIRRGILMPGAVDMHVHFRDPGSTHKEDFVSGTTAAAFGGVTFVADMPNNETPVTDARAYAKKQAAVRGRAAVDYGLVAGLDDALEALRLGAAPVAYKAYLGRSTGGLLLASTQALRRAVKRSERSGRPLIVHAEADTCLAKSDGTQENLRGHSSARSPRCEVEAIQRVVAARPSGVHVAHVTSRLALAATRGAGLTREVTPHHLLLDFNSKKRPGSLCKVNPPLRSPADRSALMSALRGGGVEVLASDHAPHTLAEKAAGFKTAPAGVPGVETMVPLMMSLVKRGGLSIRRLAEASASNPGRILGIPKGAIAPGFDADLVLYDLAEERRIEASVLHSKCGWTPFQGRQAVFPTRVWLRGEEVVTGPGRSSGALRGRDWSEAQASDRR
ncbi:MAG: dihydroorotase [Euryarchaeota archaeon]|nr:dihydroorotase [Euryarchaeota archaeon]